MPKTHAIKAYLGALREREPQWRDRIEQVTRVAAIDPSRLRMHAHTPQVLPHCLHIAFTWLSSSPCIPQPLTSAPVAVSADDGFEVTPHEDHAAREVYGECPPEVAVHLSLHG